MVDISLITVLPTCAMDSIAARVIESPILREPSAEWIVVLQQGARPEATASPPLPLHIRFRTELVRADVGTCAAIAAGWNAATGRVVVVHTWGRDVAVEELCSLRARLVRFDVAFAKKRRSPLVRQWQRIARLPRALREGLHVHDPNVHCWAARAEALEGIPRNSDSLRRLPFLVAARGYRVGEVRLGRAGARGRSEAA